MMRENLDHWIESGPDLGTPTGKPRPVTFTPISDISTQGGPDTTIEGQMALSHEQEEAETARMMKIPTDKKQYENGGGGSSKDIPYGP